ncbi:hypothetical protein H6G76_05880 [Nostoc sp. FACHB-152]|uniref:hypothetical protein n=1 Tax=unclassified Nostoc TaxID=2593658 RepID=UPI00168904C1|nr:MULTISPECIES: hypothetical protein [unclassified Nostoc]MBD2446703.1 hypothetical protein [Nostoc sp. FACHB-152]MBD2466551.1 hypothetical protein [Nostoc sp. FACHB-145]
MLKPLFKSTTASLFFIFFIILTFVTGNLMGSLPNDPKLNDKVSEKQKIIYPVLLGFIPVAVGILNFFINTKIEEEANKKIEENHKECKEKVESYAHNFLRTLGSVEIQLQKLDGNVSGECLLEVNKFKEVVRSYVINYDASQKIVKLLDNDKLRHKLEIDVIAKAVKKFDIPINSDESKAFSQDIGRCINWLRDSIDVLDYRPIYPPEMTTALKSGVKNFAPYEDALNNIKFEDKLEEASDSTRIIEKYVNYLINELKKSVNQ